MALTRLIAQASMYDEAADRLRLDRVRARAALQYYRQTAALKGVAQVLVWLREIRLGAGSHTRRRAALGGRGRAVSSVLPRPENSDPDLAGAPRARSGDGRRKPPARVGVNEGRQPLLNPRMP